MSTTKLRFLDECSTEALEELFEPQVSERLNCSLAEHVLRQVAIELFSRNRRLNERAQRAMIGPEHDRCPHDVYFTKPCGVCDALETEDQ